MNKTVLYIFITIGGMVGGYLPTLLGADGFSAWAIVGSTVGSIIGIFLAARISE